MDREKDGRGGARHGPERPQPGAAGAVVVVNYHSSRLLKANLGALGAHGTGPHVVVVDNYSGDDERAAVAALASQHGWELVPQPNHGFGAGMNAGVERALALGCDAVLLLNPDVTVSAAVVEALLEHVRVDPDALVVPLLTSPGRAGFSRGTLDLRRGLTRSRGAVEPHLEPWLSGACTAMSAPLWRRVGGLSDEYFMYWEDVELSLRVRRHGGRLVVREDLRASHAVGGTQGEGKSPLYRYWNCRNRLLFARRNLSTATRLGWLLWTPVYAWRVLLRDGRRPVLRRPHRTLLPVVCGSLAGVRELLRPARTERHGEEPPR